MEDLGIEREDSLKEVSIYWLWVVDFEIAVITDKDNDKRDLKLIIISPTWKKNILTIITN